MKKLSILCLLFACSIDNACITRVVMKFFTLMYFILLCNHAFAADVQQRGLMNALTQLQVQQDYKCFNNEGN